MDVTLYLVGKLVPDKEVADPTALKRLHFDIAFTEREAADQFIRVQQVPRAFVEPASGPVPESGEKLLLKRVTNRHQVSTLALTPHGMDALRIDPYLLESREDLALWHIEVDNGNYRAQRAFTDSKLCDPQPIPTAYGSVHRQYNKARRWVDIHLFARTEEHALDLAQEAMKQSA